MVQLQDQVSRVCGILKEAMQALDQAHGIVNQLNSTAEGLRAAKEEPPSAAREDADTAIATGPATVAVAVAVETDPELNQQSVQVAEGLAQVESAYAQATKAADSQAESRCEQDEKSAITCKVPEEDVCNMRCEQSARKAIDPEAAALVTEEDILRVSQDRFQGSLSIPGMKLAAKKSRGVFSQIWHEIQQIEEKVATRELLTGNGNMVVIEDPCVDRSCADPAPCERTQRAEAHQSSLVVRLAQAHAAAVLPPMQMVPSAAKAMHSSDSVLAQQCDSVGCLCEAGKEELRTAVAKAAKPVTATAEEDADVKELSPQVTAAHMPMERAHPQAQKEVRAQAAGTCEQAEAEAIVKKVARKVPTEPAFEQLLAESAGQAARDPGEAPKALGNEAPRAPSCCPPAKAVQAPHWQSQPPGAPRSSPPQGWPPNSADGSCTAQAPLTGPPPVEGGRARLSADRKLVAKKSLDVFTAERTIIGCLRQGEVVWASGPPVMLDGYHMVPIEFGDGIKNVRLHGLVESRHVTRVPGERAQPAWASQLRALRPCALLLGDSITEQGFLGSQKPTTNCIGWVGLLQDHCRRRVDVFNRGLSGYNSTQALAVLPRILQEHALQEPMLFAVVMFGANDAAMQSSEQHVPLPQYSSNLTEILRLLIHQGCPHIILLSPPPVVAQPHWPDRSNAHVEKYVEAAKSVAERREFRTAVRFVNVYRHMMSFKNYRMLLDDGLHLSAQGQCELFKCLIPMLPELPCVDLPSSENLPGVDTYHVRRNSTWHVNLHDVCELAATQPSW